VFVPCSAWERGYKYGKSFPYEGVDYNLAYFQGTFYFKFNFNYFNAHVSVGKIVSIKNDFFVIEFEAFKGDWKQKRSYLTKVHTRDCDSLPVSFQIITREMYNKYELA
jgi:hypothetical protein